MCVATILFLNKRHVTNLNLVPERLLLGCHQEGEGEEEVGVEGELLQEQGQAREEEGEAEGVGEVECWVGTVDLKKRCEKYLSAHKRAVNMNQNEAVEGERVRTRRTAVLGEEGQVRDVVHGS